MQGINSGRRAALAALAALALATALPVAAQDPSVGLARASAMDWLGLVDRNEAIESYNAAGSRFRSQMTVEQWGTAIAQGHEQFGPVESRTFVGARAVEPSKDASQGEFAVLGFRTEYGKRKIGTETVTLEREADGKWRVVGYLMQ